MIQTEDQFVRLQKGQFEAVEDANDHPAGAIASFLTKSHGGEQNVVGFEHKVRSFLSQCNCYYTIMFDSYWQIMHMLWKSRAELHEELGHKDVPSIDESGQTDYQRLIDHSKVWWDLLRRLKVRKLRSRFHLTIPREFGTTDQAGSVEIPLEDEVSSDQ